MNDETENFFAMDRFAGAIIAFRDLALNAKIKPALIKKLAKLNREAADAVATRDAARQEAAEIVAKAHSDVAAIHEDAQRRLEAVESAEQELAQRERRITQLEQSWRLLGEPADVLAGFRSPEFSPLQKARMAHGQPPGKDSDILGLMHGEPAVPPDAIDALIRRDVGDERSDFQGNAFTPSTLTRSTEHKRKSAA